jgi:hypothetical protein
MIDTRRPDNLSGIFGILSGKVRLINQYIEVLNQDSILLHQRYSNGLSKSAFEPNTDCNYS